MGNSRAGVPSPGALGRPESDLAWPVLRLTSKYRSPLNGPEESTGIPLKGPFRVGIG